jgi:hypothetical protein
MHPQLLLLALACLVGLDACWRGDLAPLATRASAARDAALVDDPDLAPSGIDGATENVIVLDVSDPGDGGQATGQIALSVGLPIDTATGQVVAIGSVNIKLTSSDHTTARALTLQLGRPRAQVAINLTDVPAGGPYQLEVSGAAAATACATPSPKFSVPSGQTVGVAIALVCLGDGGWSATL